VAVAKASHSFGHPGQDGKGGTGEEDEGLGEKEPDKSYLNKEGTASLLPVNQNRVHPRDYVFPI